MFNIYVTHNRGGFVNQVLSRLFAIVSVCCVLSVLSEEISYNYVNVGVSLSDRNSEYLNDDLNFHADVNFSQERDQILSYFDHWSVHYWIDFTQSRNLSPSSAYELTLKQFAAGFGLHYTKDSFSAYFRLGTEGNQVRFKLTSNRSWSVPILPAESDDIFIPPYSIFSVSNLPGTTYKNLDFVPVSKIGIRYRTSYKYEVGVAFRLAKLTPFGNELSAYIQRDFENLPISTQTTSGFWGGYMSMRLDALVSENTRSVGLSIAYSF